MAAVDAESRRAVGDALELVARSLRPWMEARLGVWPPDRAGNVAPYDPHYLGNLLSERWLTDFAGDFGPDGHLLVNAFRHSRNRWAHHVPTSKEDAVRCVETCQQILVAIESPASSELDSISRDLAAPALAEGSTARVTNGPPQSHRRMRSSSFRDEQWRHRFDPHVAPINELVDRLIEERDGSWMPYIPPYHGGIESEIVLLYQDPGKMTSVDYGGSGFLGCENDDPSAQVVGECLDAAGLSPRRVTPWNAYPWFLPEQGGLSVSMLMDGLDPLRQLLALMPRVHTVVSGGSRAHDSWARFTRR